MPPPVKPAGADPDTLVYVRPAERTTHTARLVELTRAMLIEKVVTDDGNVVPAGSVGTIVGVWGEGAGYEIEFSEPVAGLATVRADQLSPDDSGGR